MQVVVVMAVLSEELTKHWLMLQNAGHKHLGFKDGAVLTSKHVFT